MATSPTPSYVPYRWHHELKQLFVLSLERYRVGERNPDQFFAEEGRSYLASIGMKPQELYDFVEDHARGDGDPDWETVLLISAARRDYFLTVQHGQASEQTVSMDNLPAKSDQLDGIAWLPRIIKKAEAKLRGEMPPDLMYGCGGDRNFFREQHLNAADFLRHVWASHGDAQKVAGYVKQAKADGDKVSAKVAASTE